MTYKGEQELVAAFTPKFRMTYIKIVGWAFSPTNRC